MTAPLTGPALAEALRTEYRMIAESGILLQVDDARAAVLSMVSRYRMPAEWERHRATWIAWPHHEPDWPGKIGPIPWVYAEIARVLHHHERVEILCHSPAIRTAATRVLAAHGVSRHVRLHLCPTDRAWLRDSGPTGVHRADGSVHWVHWGFNAWAKYPNHRRDAAVGRFIATQTKLPRREALRPDTGRRAILEGGGIETDGRGTMLVTEEWLLSRVQVRNRGMRRAEYEALFAAELGIRHTIWLGEGCVGDDTHGHIDDICRFTDHKTLVLIKETKCQKQNVQLVMQKKPHSFYLLIHQQHWITHRHLKIKAKVLIRNCKIMLLKPTQTI